MILQGSLRLEYNNEAYSLLVKTFLKNGVYYFFVSDKEKEKSLLDGETLELTYSESFCNVPATNDGPGKRISPDIVAAIQNMLLQNKELWFY